MWERIFRRIQPTLRKAAFSLVMSVRLYFHAEQPCFHFVSNMEVAKIRDFENWRINKCRATLAHLAAVNESKVQVLQKARNAI